MALNEPNEEILASPLLEPSKLPDIISSHNSKPDKNASVTNEDEGAVPYFCSIDPDEIPSIPDKKFLTRVAPEDDLKDRDKDDVDPENDDRNSAGKEKRKKEWRIGPDGMKIKGRGTMRYNPYADRERSITPPHWKNNTSFRPMKRNLPDSKDDKGDLFTDNGNADNLNVLRAKRNRSREKDRSDRTQERNTRFDKFYRMREEERLHNYNYSRSRRKHADREEEAHPQENNEIGQSSQHVSSVIEQRLIDTISQRVKTEMNEDTGPPEEGECLDPIPFRPRSPKRKKKERKDSEEGTYMNANDDERRPSEKSSPRKSRGSRKSKSRSRSLHSGERKSITVKNEGDSKSRAIISKSIEASISERFKSIANYSLNDIMTSKSSSNVDAKSGVNTRSSRNADEEKEYFTRRKPGSETKRSFEDLHDIKVKRERSTSRKSDQRRTLSPERRRKKSRSIEQRSKRSKSRSADKRGKSKSHSPKRRPKSKSPVEDRRKRKNSYLGEIHKQNKEDGKGTHARNKSRSRSPSRDKRRSRSNYADKKRGSETKRKGSRENRLRGSVDDKERRRRESERSRSANRRRQSSEKDRKKSGNISGRHDEKQGRRTKDSHKNTRSRRRSHSKSSSPEDLFNLSALV